MAQNSRKHIHASFSNSSNGKFTPSEAIIQLGSHVSICTEVLKEYYGKTIDQIDYDILYLSGCLSFADRYFVRHVSWSRDIHVSIEVSSPRNLQAIEEDLVKLLHEQTGDNWSFTFLQRSREMDTSIQLKLFEATTTTSTLTYSGGLDSLCGLIDWLNHNPRGILLLLNVALKSTMNSPELRYPTEKFGRTRLLRLPINFSYKPAKLRETSCRTRTFQFLTTAAIAAKLSGGSEVVVSEGGQGSLGPYLFQRGLYETPYASTSPLISFQLAHILNRLWSSTGHKVRFTHPLLWETKAESLRRLIYTSATERDAWKYTRSCSWSAARHKKANTNTQCGICANCIHRRVALSAANIMPISGGDEIYHWQDLSFRNFFDIPTANAPTLPNDYKRIVSSIEMMESLTSIDTTSAGRFRVQQLAAKLHYCTNLPVNVIESKIQSLISTHKRDWNHALSELPEQSFVHSLTQDYRL